jgi:hypothetical protein
MSRAVRNLSIAIASAVIGLTGAFIAIHYLGGPKDLKSALAASLHLPKDEAKRFFVNLPPAGSRYPGAIIAPPEMLVLEESSANEDGIIPGNRFVLTASDSTVANALSGFNSQLLRTMSHDKDDVSVELHVNNGQVLEMAVPTLKQKLLGSNAAQSAANKGTDPLIITRAYVGDLSFAIKKKSDAGAKLIAQAAKSPDLKSNSSLSISADQSGQGELTITVKDPIVFAFEASSARYLTQHLGARPDSVTLTPIEPKDIPPPKSGKFQASTAWTLATISSGFYSHLRNLDQPWNAASADLVEGTLSAYGPAVSLRLRASETVPLTSQRMADFVSAVADESKKRNSKLIVVYYIGHMVSWPDRDIALILGDAEQIPDLTRERTNLALRQQFGSAVGSLFELSDVLNANLEPLPKGFLPLRELYSELENSNVRFALIVDGCLRNDEFEKLRAGLGIVSDSGTNTFFFVGPDQKLLTSLDQFDSYLRHFSDTLPYLRTANPVVLAAKPGTFAQPHEDPDATWTPVGPLAARLTHFVRAREFDAPPPTLGEALANVTDYKGVGEIDPKGSISWSDFEQLKRTTAVMALNPGT